MSKALGRTLLAPVIGALLLLGAPSATLAAPEKEKQPPSAGEGDKAKQGSDKAKQPEQGGDKAKQPEKEAGKDAKEPPKGGDQAAPPKSDKKGDNKDGKDGDDDYGRRYDRDDGHYDHARYGRHYRHSHRWDTHPRYYRYGYRGPGYYDDCGYYGPDGHSHGYYDSADACSYQYGRQGESMRANLSGDQVVPGPGAPNAVGIANVFVDFSAGVLCFRLGYDGIDRPSMAHIHRGGPGQTGKPVIDLHPEQNGDEGCVGADPTALRNLRDHPEAFYLNLHTPEYPDGAMRGQLFPTGRY